MREHMKDKRIKICHLSKKEIGKDEELAGIIGEIMNETWGDPCACDIVSDFMSVADTMYVAKSEERIAGFATADFVDKNTLYLHATIVHKDFSGLGLYKKLNNKLISEFAGRHLFSALLGFWCVFRTSNPSLYERVYKNFPLFPDYKNDRKPTTRELNVFRRIYQITSPQNDADFETFVVKKAYLSHPGVIRKPEETPYAFNSDINEFFENKLHLTEMEGSAMICMGRINLLMIIKQFIKNIIGTHR